jgi:hypothetical protein
VLCSFFAVLDAAAAPIYAKECSGCQGRLFDHHVYDPSAFYHGLQGIRWTHDHEPGAAHLLESSTMPFPFLRASGYFWISSNLTPLTKLAVMVYRDPILYKVTSIGHSFSFITSGHTATMFEARSMMSLLHQPLNHATIRVLLLYVRLPRWNRCAVYQLSLVVFLFLTESQMAFDIGILILIGAIYKVLNIIGVFYKAARVTKFVDE